MSSRSWLGRARALCFALAPVVAVVPAAAQRPVPAQRGGAPGPETPQLVVSTLASSDPSIGAAVTDAIRRRIQSEHNATELYVVPALTIERALKESGFNPDSALGAADRMALTKIVRGDYALDGDVERSDGGVRTSIRLLSQNGAQVVAEPLAPIMGADAGDIAKQVDRAVSEAVRALAFNHECRKALVTGDYAKARAAAEQGLHIKPASPALELCVLSTLTATKAAPDSIIAVASAVTAADSANLVAWAGLADAFAEKGDSAHALEALLAVHRLEPANVAAVTVLVDRLVGAGQSERASALLDSAVNDKPSNVELLRKRWLLHLRLGQFDRALTSGAALVAADSSSANEDYFARQLGAANSAHDSVATRRLASEAVARFPKNVDFLLILARDAVNSSSPREGLPFADRVLALEAGNTAAWQLAIGAYARLGATDSAIATAHRALAAGVARDVVSGSLVGVLAPALAAAQKSNARIDWQTVLRQSMAVDSVAPSARSAFYVGVSAFQIATDDIQSLAAAVKSPPTTRAGRQSACTSASSIEDLVRTAAIALPRGGSVDPAVATRIVGALPGYSEYVNSVKQASCRRDDEGPGGEGP